jgi:hypothetical protein
VVPPGALPNGSGPGTAYIPQISAWSEASAAATAQAIMAEIRAARQKAAEEAAAAALRRQCEEDPELCGGGAPGSGGMGQQGGEEQRSSGEYTSESGDPIVCHVKGEIWSPPGDPNVHMGAEIGCNQWIRGLQFQFCAQELEGGTSVWNECRTPLNGEGGHSHAKWQQLNIECNGGRYYRGWLWWGYPEGNHFRAFKELLKPVQC